MEGKEEGEEAKIVCGSPQLMMLRSRNAPRTVLAGMVGEGARLVPPKPRGGSC